MNRRVIAAGLSAAVLLGTGSGWLATDAHAVPPWSSPITAAAGAHAVGRINTMLTDASRIVMTSVWYPATGTGTTPYVPAIGLAAQLRIADQSAQWMHTPRRAAVTMVAATVAATENAPADLSLGRLPVLILSPGLGTPRWILSGLAEEIASRGYVVVVIDHIGEAPAVELPDGRIVGGAPTQPQDPGYMAARLDERVADMRLVLDRLNSLPTVGAVADLGRIVAGGHSYGGTTAVTLAAADPRIRAVVMIDAPAGWPGVAGTARIDQPVLALQLTTPWPQSWPRQPGADTRTIHGAAHYAATDLCSFGGGIDLCGTLPAAEATARTRAVITDWLTRHN